MVSFKFLATVYSVAIEIQAGGVLYIKNTLRAQVLHSSQTTQRGKPMKPEYLICKL